MAEAVQKAHPQGANASDMTEESNGPVQPTGNVQEGPKPDPKTIGDEGAPEGVPADDGTVKPPEKAADPTAPVEEPGPEKGSDAWHKQFIQTGNEHADAAIDVMKEAGVSPLEANAVFQKALETGNLADIDYSLLEDKLGKAKTALVKAGVQTFFDTEYKGRIEVVNKAHEIVGGKENWELVKAWAKKTEKTDTTVKAKVDNIRKAIDVGGWTAEQAVGELKRMYEAGPDNKGLGTKNIVQGTSDGVKAAEGGPLTRAQFIAETHKLNESGIDPSGPQAIALFHRHQKFLAQR